MIAVGHLAALNVAAILAVAACAGSAVAACPGPLHRAHA